MGMIFDAQQQVFHLQGKEISYIFTVLKNKQLGHLYFGKQLRHSAHFPAHIQHLPRPNMACVFEGDLSFSMDDLPQEFPAYGSTDFRHPAYQIQNADGNTITTLEYQSHAMRQGKPKLAGLPATYVERDSEATTLEVTLVDRYLDLYAILSYTVYEERNVITRSVRFENRGKQSLRLLRALSMSVDFPDVDFEMTQLSGAWARERHVFVRPLAPGMQSIESARGASSPHHNPFVALKRPNADEFQGEVYGFNLVYSGNFLAEIEVSYYNQTRLSMGINPFDFAWLLEPGASFQTPEVVMAYSDRGLNGLSQTYHALYRDRLARGDWRDRDRPILVNNWEATYFNFNEDKLLALARAAKELEIELLVLDDGWFGHRDDDTSSLGDWVVDRRKLPRGLGYLGEEIEKLGLKFGLWLEPEMISKDSELYRQHPDWLIHAPNRTLSHGRNQFVLDYSRQDVRDAVFAMLEAILANAPISYVKWDMNRYMTEIGSAALPPERQKETAHRYMLGLYDLLERITQRFPRVLFESCASGGARFDPGMLYYMPQTWTSDDTDAVERLKIQYGTSFAYPLSAMGAHVSAVPNHQVGRVTPFDTRAHVALFGVFGYELDLEQLSAQEREAVKAHNRFYKANRQLLHHGTFYRLTSPFDSNFACWMVVSADQRAAILGYYTVLAQPNPPASTVKLQGLRPEWLYAVEGVATACYGDELMQMGFLLPLPHHGDFQSFVWKLQANA